MKDRKQVLGEKLAELRNKCGLSQENVAEYLNVDQSYVSKIEKGERSIDSVSLEALADLYLIPVSDLLNGSENSRFNVSFRKDKYSHDDMVNLAAVNRIALNQKQMDEPEEADEDR